MRWVFNINGTDYDDPVEWDKAEVIIERDSDLPGGILTAYQNEVIFQGDAYDYIFTQVSQDGWCQLFTVTISYECNGALSALGDGFIMYANEFQIDERRCRVRAVLHENSYASYIVANKKIPYYPNSAESKSGNTITIPTNKTIDFFTPSTGVNTASNREFYLVSEVLEGVVQFMTDGAVSVTAPPFDAGGTWEGLCIGTGKAIRQTAADAPPEITFEDLYLELYKRFNLGFYLSAGVMTIDERDNIYTGSTGITLSKVYEVLRAYKTELAYSKVVIGTGTTQKSEGGTFQWPDARFFNFKTEEYFVDYLCNADAELDLVGEYITDSNVIEDIVVNNTVSGDEEYDDDIVLVETDLPGTGQATPFDEFNIGAAPYVYNRNLTNREIAARWLDWIPNEMTLYVGNGADNCDVTKNILQTVAPTTIPITIQPVSFDVEALDPNNRFNNAVGFYRYTAGGGAGFYRFGGNLVVNFTPNAPQYTYYDIDIYFDRFNAGATLLESRNVVSSTNVTAAQVNNSLSGGTGFYMDATDYVDVRVVVVCGPGPGAIGATIDLIAGNNSRFLTLEWETGGGSFADFDQDDYKIKTYTTSHPLPVADFITILNNPEQSIDITWVGINDALTTVTGFIDKLSYKMDKQILEVTIVKSRN